MDSKQVKAIVGGGVLGGLTKITWELVDSNYQQPNNLLFAVPSHCLLGVTSSLMVVFLAGNYFKIKEDLSKSFALAIASGFLFHQVLGHIKKQGQLQDQILMLEQENKAVSELVIEVEREKIDQLQDINRRVTNPQLKATLEKKQQDNIASVEERATEFSAENVIKDAIASIDDAAANSKSTETHLTAIASLLKVGNSTTITEEALDNILHSLGEYQQSSDPKVSEEARKAIRTLLS